MAPRYKTIKIEKIPLSLNITSINDFKYPRTSEKKDFFFNKNLSI
jgi:hypothetical protein